MTGTRHRYTVAQTHFIRKEYRRFSEKELLLLFNKRFSRTPIRIGQLQGFIANHRILSGRTGCFPKGHLPFNTGTKGISKANSGTFKKGNVPANIRKMGAARLDSKDGYLLVKVHRRNKYTGCPTSFLAKHVFLWESKHGPTPKGHTIIFKDGNKENIGLKNLACISRAELLRLNQCRYQDCPGPLKPTVLALAKLEVRTFRLQKKIKPVKKSQAEIYKESRNNLRPPEKQWPRPWNPGTGWISVRGTTPKFSEKTGVCEI